MRDCMFFFFLHQFEGQHQPLGLVSCWASEEAGILRLDQLGTHEFQDVSRCFMVVLWSRRRGYRSVHEPTAHLISWLFFLCTDSFVDFLRWHYPLISPIVHTVGPSPAAPYLCCVALDILVPYGTLPYQLSRFNVLQRMDFMGKILPSLPGGPGRRHECGCPSKGGFVR